MRAVSYITYIAVDHDVDHRLHRGRFTKRPYVAMCAMLFIGGMGGVDADRPTCGHK